MDAERSPASVWLDERLSEVPTDLADAVRALVRTVDIEGPDDLASAALEGFERMAGADDARTGALELLAADALLTYAFEAAADPGLGGTRARAEALADTFGPAGLIGRSLERMR
ncbi:MAG: hypothetical protein MJB57_06495 [Gemmatimonadetes bacterium]|nr:hypothetical protein [Gemmatimonadota bacterium]